MWWGGVCRFAHSLEELRLPPANYATILKANKFDRWLGNYVTEEQAERLLLYYRQAWVRVCAIAD